MRVSSILTESHKRFTLLIENQYDNDIRIHNGFQRYYHALHLIATICYFRINVVGYLDGRSLLYHNIGQW